LDHPFSTYAEAIRSIVAALTISRPDHDPKVLLFNSGGPGEGKTTLAVSLAVYLSKLGRRVILLDLDMRRPSVAIELGERVNGVRPRPLDEGRRLEDFIQPVQGLPLDFLAAPRGISDEPLSLFESSELSRLVQTLRARYDYVIIDSAPLLVIAESRLLTRLADKVVFVVEWGKTRRQVAVNALGLMLNRSFGDEIDGGNIVAVVSRVNLRKHARYDYGDSGEFLLAYRDYITGTKKIAS
jgi:Mrp family chromosome partitioning ATPase